MDTKKYPPFACLLLSGWVGFKPEVQSLLGLNRVS